MFKNIRDFYTNLRDTITYLRTCLRHRKLLEKSLTNQLFIHDTHGNLVKSMLITMHKQPYHVGTVNDIDENTDDLVVKAPGLFNKRETTT